MKLSHYSYQPIKLVFREYQQDDLKPVGFWVSVDGSDDWPSWCRGEDYSLADLTFQHRVTLVEKPRLLILASIQDMDEFTKGYGYQRRGSRSIDWGRVAAQWQGIVIAPYIWERRLSPHTFWYYTWDCASGCIWDMSAIESCELLQITPWPERQNELSPD